VIVKTLEETPVDATHWSTQSMARATGLSQSAISRVWRAFGLKPHLVDTFKLSPDPPFVEKVRDIVGLSVNPPDGALVLCVEEKSLIQALGRTQPVLPLRPGLPERRTYDSVRHGTTNLDAALDVTSRMVISDMTERNRAHEFRRFLNLWVPNTHPGSSRDKPVLVNEAAEDVCSSKAHGVGVLDRIRCECQVARRPLVQGAVRTIAVVVREILGQDLLEMTASEDKEPVQTLSADGADKTLGERVRLWGSNRSHDDPDALGAEHLVEAGGELRVSVTDQELDLSGTLAQDETQVAGLLGDPPPTGLAVDTRESDPPGVDLDEEQHVQAPQEHRVDRKEVAGQHARCLCSHELGPGRARSPRRGLDAVPAQDGPHARGGASRTPMVASSAWIRR
jgi:hypothetical protein